MLNRLWISLPLSSRLFIPEDSSCILVGDLYWDLCCDDRARDLYIFPLFHRASCDNSVSLYTCIYVLNVYIDIRRTVAVIYGSAKFVSYLDANLYVYLKHQIVHKQWSLLMTFKCMRLSGCNA